MSLRELPARAIVHAIADAAERWSDADFPPRVRLLDGIVARTGYSFPVVEYALDALFFSMTVPAIVAAIENELGSLDALDGFAPRNGRPPAWARGLDRIGIISSRTTIGVALAPAIFALCAKANVLVKDREDGLVAAFFETLAQERAEFRHSAQARGWNARESAGELRGFDAVVAFGRDATLGEIRAGLDAQTRFIGYGSRASVGYISREWLHDEAGACEIATRAARDVVLYDTEGCMSLHALFVETGAAIDPTHFGKLLADGIVRSAIEFPLGAREPARAAAIASARNLAAFRASAGTGAVFADASASYAVFVDPPLGDPPLFLPRTLAIYAVSEPAEALAYLNRHGIALEAFALAGERPEVLRLAVDAGAVRIARFGELQRPPLHGDHGGRPRIADFIRWIDKDL